MSKNKQARRQGRQEDKDGSTSKLELGFFVPPGSHRRRSGSAGCRPQLPERRLVLPVAHGKSDGARLVAGVDTFNHRAVVLAVVDINARAGVANGPSASGWGKIEGFYRERERERERERD